MNLITSAQGSPHVTPQDDATIWRSIVGTESAVFEWGDDFEVFAISNTKVGISSGLGMNQGRMFAVAVGSSDEVAIDVGTQGQNRIDVICQRIQVNSGAGTQSGSWYVVKGTPSYGEPQVPTVNEGRLDLGDTTALFPMFTVRLTGINITGIDPIYKHISPPVRENSVMSKGSATNPVYFDGSGAARPTTYQLNKTVPSNALFTDTTNLQSMTGVLPVGKGGTGGTSAAEARAGIGIDNLLQVKTVTGTSQSVAAGSTYSWQISHSLSGYAGLGIVGISGLSGLSIVNFDYDDANIRARLTLYNPGGAAITATPIMAILYAKSI